MAATLMPVSLVLPLPVRVARREPARVALRRAGSGDVEALHAFIARHRDEGHLLPRAADEIARHASRFFVAADDRGLVGCAELAPLGPAVAEVRSLAVDARARGTGVGRRLVDAVIREARQRGIRSITAFTHDPRFFVRLGFSLVPHTWVPEKIATDCAGCPLFRRCGQRAVRLELAGRPGAQAPGPFPMEIPA